MWYIDILITHKESDKIKFHAKKNENSLKKKKKSMFVEAKILIISADGIIQEYLLI